NADDYYGKVGFVKASEYLEKNDYGMVGYILKNTLSDNGGVSRGVCTVENGELKSVDETHNIVKTETGAESEGRSINPECLVSMNFWCLPAEFMNVVREGLPEFLQHLKNPLKDEYLLPTVVDGLIKSGVKCTVLTSGDRWFGVTYKEDKPSVVESFKDLYEKGVYKSPLYSDLK
nr:nucleotidyltransferase [Clostridiales bacterium]